MHFRRKIPSLTALIALEAVIRHRSVTAAARELSVTQAAVSRQIALLEKEFGRPLFTRGHRTIEPTPTCLLLGSSLAESFNNIADAVDVLKSDSSDVVTIGATIAFSSFWLLPKLSEFRKAHPGIQLRVVSQDGNFSLASGEADVVLRYGTPALRGGIVVATRSERVFPVCSPDYRSGQDLSVFPSGACELIETDVLNRGWYRWSDWLARAGQRVEGLKPTLRFSHYTETISAARRGQGIALGWDVLVRPHLDDGSLVKVGDVEIEPEGVHMIVVPFSPRRSIACDLVREWLVQAFQHPT